MLENGADLGKERTYAGGVELQDLGNLPIRQIAHHCLFEEYDHTIAPCLVQDLARKFDQHYFVHLMIDDSLIGYSRCQIGILVERIELFRALLRAPIPAHALDRLHDHSIRPCLQSTFITKVRE